ncbi:MAG: RluA family pseudouridine synthase [Actinobacteria bacterium]|nr:RluA family pseudouridine synthase [Actinomycetota bacterium]
MLTGLSRADAAALVAAGAVRVSGDVRTSGKERLAEGDELAVAVPAAADGSLRGEASVPFEVVSADDDVIVVDKPAGVVVHPGAGNPDGTLVQGLLGRFPELARVGESHRPGIVHRLDKGTSGLLVVARTERAHQRLSADMRAHRVERTYLALVRGTPEPQRGLIDAPIGRSAREPTRMAVSTRGRTARTRYEVEASWPSDDVALVRCGLETGRTHQIRVHLAAIGHPVEGDRRYGGRPRAGIDRPFLHAARLAFVHPGSGAPVAFESPLPADLDRVIGALGRPVAAARRPARGPGVAAR